MFFFIDENTKTIGLEKKHIHITIVKFQIKKKTLLFKIFFSDKILNFLRRIDKICVCVRVCGHLRMFCVFLTLKTVIQIHTNVST